jgi:hypothetical protein
MVIVQAADRWNRDDLAAPFAARSNLAPHGRYGGDSSPLQRATLHMAREKPLPSQVLCTWDKTIGMQAAELGRTHLSLPRSAKLVDIWQRQ